VGAPLGLKALVGKTGHGASGTILLFQHQELEFRVAFMEKCSSTETGEAGADNTEIKK